MTLYVYDTESMAVVVEIEGESNAECEGYARERGYEDEAYGWTYSPALGASGGCYETTETIKANATASRAAAILGRKGGQAKSEAKTAANRAKGKLGGRPKMRRVMVKGRYGDGMEVEIILRDGKTATRGQYESAIRRLGGHSPVGDGLVLVNKDDGEIPVYDGDQPWAMLS